MFYCSFEKSWVQKVKIKMGQTNNCLKILLKIKRLIKFLLQFNPMKENSLTGKNKAIIELYDEQITIREIARLLKVPNSTVSRVIIKHREHGNIGRKIGSGRPKLVSTREIAEIRSIRSAELKISATKLATKLNEVCNYKGTVQTVRHSLVSLGISAYSPCMKPLLSDKNIALRYSLAQRWSYLPETYWNNVIFSYGCKFHFFTSDGKGYIWREKGVRLDPKYLSPTIKSEVVILWYGGIFPQKVWENWYLSRK